MARLFADGRAVRVAVDLFSVAVVISVAAALAELSWRLAAGSRSSPAPAVAAGPAAAGGQGLASIFDLAPFGRPDAALAQATALPLELKGTLLATPLSASSAWIAAKDQAAKELRVGDPVAGATVAAIARDHVLLKVGGRIERLSFPQAGASTPASQALSPPPVAQAGPVPMAPPRQPSEAPPPAPPTATAANAPPTVAELGQTVPDTGFRIGAGLPGLLEDSGLMPGDLVEEVNGTRLGDPAHDGQLIADAAMNGSAQLTVLRGGRRITLTVSR